MISERQWERSKDKPGFALADNFDDHFGITMMLHRVLTYRVVDECFQAKDKEKKEKKKEKDKEKKNPTWDEIGKLLDKKLGTMSTEEYGIAIGIAKSVYGLTKMRYETEIDKLFRDKMVDLEIITDTGHLTTVFKDCLQITAKEENITLEELAKDKNILFAIIVEFTKQEDFDDPREYLDKKTEHEIQEYIEMARVVSRYILADTIRTNEKLEIGE